MRLGVEVVRISYRHAPESPLQLGMSFEQLRVYQAAQELRREVDELAKVLDPRFKNLFDHLDDAVDSIMNNLSEGSDSIYPAKRASFYDIALGSAKEARSILKSLDRRGAFRGRRVFRAIVLAMAIAKMIRAMIDELRSRHKL